MDHHLPFGMSKSRRNSEFLYSPLLTVKVSQRHRGKACYMHRSYHIYGSHQAFIQAVNQALVEKSDMATPLPTT